MVAMSDAPEFDTTRARNVVEHDVYRTSFADVIGDVGQMHGFTFGDPRVRGIVALKSSEGSATLRPR